MESANKFKQLLLIGVIAALIGGLAGGFLASKLQDNSEEATASALSEQDQLVKDYYDVENAVGVSPHTLRKAMDQGSLANTIIVDLRSEPEYKQEHIIGAISIPATNLNNTVDFVNKFKDLPQDKTIVTYCYSSACMLSRQVGKLLAENGIFTKHLNIGWNEWRYDWQSWNAPSEWDSTKPEDYVASGSEPGEPTVRETSAACTAGELGC